MLAALFGEHYSAVMTIASPSGSIPRDPALTTGPCLSRDPAAGVLWVEPSNLTQPEAREVLLAWSQGSPCPGSPEGGQAVTDLLPHQGSRAPD